MIRKAIEIASVLLATAPAPAFAQDNYYVRNGTGRALTCGLRREPQRRIDRFLLLRDTEAVRTARGGRLRTLACDTRPRADNFRMRPGIRYSLVDDEGVVRLRRVDPSGLSASAASAPPPDRPTPP
jgi:hypothetical protein